MKGDFTRFTFAKQRRYTGVLEQQGRVELDADANEQVAIRDHLRHTTNIDVIGRTGAPENFAGFGITPDGSGLAIGAGRMYVDGILCELDEAVTYATQPHLPTPDPLAPADGRTDLVYLDVWQRHVSAVEDPTLLDPALDGLDTTTRVQTIWQVRVAPDIGDASCAEALADLPHSGAQLTSGAIETPAAETPCDIVVAGGYRGVENRLYRVEIHEGGGAGTATWKWSRDNGAVAFPIEEFLTGPADRIRLRSPGRDRYLALRQDDWVEIHDDASELGLRPGFMAQVASVDEATRIVTLDRDVPADTFDLARNPRVRRWDQTEDVDGDGLLTASAGAHDLEDGVQVTFGGSDFRTGDWWAFAARTAEGTVEQLTDAPAAGITHHYAALARIQWNATGEESFAAEVLEDCRDTFPPLTDICADDVCFDNGNCALPGAVTVQDAIDQLCAGRDLRWHNRHLHGWGIVCGLQVVCGPDDANRGRRNVTVRSGYALDCDGSDLILREDVTVDLLDRIQALDRLDPDNPILVEGDGEVCLVLGRNGGSAAVEIERYEASDNNVFAQALEGTLLKDFFDGCVKSVLDFLREQTQDEDDRLVGAGRRRRITFLNLLVQLGDSVNGRHVWISAEEDRILRQFYPRLRELLRSRTFCAMFENARPLPDYPFSDVPQPTVFGKGNHTRLRLRAGTPLAYTAGNGNSIHLYDLEKREMLAEIEFPGGSGVAVRDVAVSRNGRQLHAIATLGGDTLFATADISGDEHRFRPVTVMRDVELVTLALAPEGTNILTVGRGRGLYEFNPASPPSSPVPRNAFNAVGHLVVHAETRLIYATARSEGTPDVYDRIVRLQGGGTAPPVIHPLTDLQGLPRTGTDDIAVVPAGLRRWKLYAVANSPVQGTKDILAYDVATSPNAPATATGMIPVDAATMRMASIGPNRMAVTRRERNDVIVVDTIADRVLPDRSQDGEDFRHPVQIGPVAIVTEAQGERAFVLNQVSDTIAVVPVGLLDPANAIDRAALAAYRDGMIAAVTDLLAGLLQYLKDCLCDRLLVNCPDCDDEDRVYLGCVSIRGGAVHHVCNFSKRKYVRSFPTVEYWLSLVPVLPMIGVLIERLCCAVLPDLFARFVPESATKGTTLNAARLGSAIGLAGRFDTRTLFSGIGSRFDLAGRFAGDWLRAPGAAEKGGRRGIQRDEVFGQETPGVRERLEQAGATIAGVEPFDPGTALLDVARPRVMPSTVAPGERVVLFQDEQGIVRHWNVVRAAAPTATTPDLDAGLRRIDDAVRELDTTREQLAGARDQIQTLQNELARVERESTAALGTRDRQIEALERELTRVERESASALETRDRTLKALQDSNRKLETELGTLERLRADVELLKRRPG